VARFDGRKWLPISEQQVIHEPLVEMDVWRDVAVLLTRTGQIWRMDMGQGLAAWTQARPRKVLWDRRQDAFVADGGAPRLLHSLRGFDGGALIASDGGVIAVGTKEPLFHAAPESAAPARLARVGNDDNARIVVMCGSAAWIFDKGELKPIDLRNLS
jgi:hypothetical protein